MRRTHAQDEEMAQLGGVLPEDDFYTVLGNARRRECIKYLLDADGTVSVGELADHMVAVESDEGGGRRKSAYVALRQTHLPTLADYGVVEYDPDTNEVAPGSNLAAFAPGTDDDRDGRDGDAVEALADDGVKWGWAYAVLSLAGLAWVGGVWTGLFSLADPVAHAMTALYLALILVLGVCEVRFGNPI